MHSRNILLSTKSRNHSLRSFFPTLLFSSASEVDRRQKESVVIGRQSNVVETSATESKNLWEKKVPPICRMQQNRQSVAQKCGEILLSYILVTNCDIFRIVNSTAWCQKFNFYLNKTTNIWGYHTHGCKYKYYCFLECDVVKFGRVPPDVLLERAGITNYQAIKREFLKVLIFPAVSMNSYPFIWKLIPRWRWVSASLSSRFNSCTVAPVAHKMRTYMESKGDLGSLEKKKFLAPKESPNLILLLHVPQPCQRTFCVMPRIRLLGVREDSNG